MSQEEVIKDEFQLDRPWNPISYFEEENEATGGNDAGTSYSPNRLASLFETNISPVEQNFLKIQLFHEEQSTSLLSSITDENSDDLSQYTLETDNGIKVLDTTYEINRKAIFHDLDRLHRWQESIDKPNKDVYISDTSCESYSYQISPEPTKESENSQFESEIDLMLQNLPDVRSKNDSDAADTTLEKLTELDRQLSESDYVLPTELKELYETDTITTSINQKLNNNQELTEDSYSNSTNILETDNLLVLLEAPTQLIDFDSENVNCDSQPSSEAQHNTLSENVGFDLLDDIQYLTHDGNLLDICDTEKTNQMIDIITENIISSNDTVEVDTLLDIAESVIVSSTEIECVDANLNSRDTVNDDNINDNIEIKVPNIDFKVQNMEIADKNEETNEVNLLNIMVDQESLNKQVSHDSCDSSSNSPNVERSISQEIENEDSSFVSQTVSPEIGNAQLMPVMIGLEESKEHQNTTEPDEQAINIDSNVNISEGIVGVTERNTSSVEHMLDNVVEEVKQEEIEFNKEVVEKQPTMSNVDLSSVHRKECIQCLTPDDEDDGFIGQCDNELSDIATTNSEERDDSFADSASHIPLLGSSNSGITATSNGLSSEEVNDSVEVEADLNSVQEQAEVTVEIHSETSNNVAVTIETSSTEDTVVGFSSLNVNDNSLDEMFDALEEELVAGAESDNTSSQSCVAPEATLSSAMVSCDHSQDIVEDHVPDDSTSDVTNNTAVDSPEVFEEPPNEPAEEEPSPPPPPPRSAGSIRRVRFSLDPDVQEPEQERAETDNETPSIMAVEEEATVAETSAQPSAISDEMKYLGWYIPRWIPDEEAKSCMKCNIKFTVVKRRHHCRACGRVLCGQCCNMKFHMPYLDYKPARVCQTCCDIMITVLNASQAADFLQPPPQQQPHQATVSPRTLPEAPPPYSEAVDGGRTERLGSSSSDAPPYEETAATDPRYSEQPAPVMPAAQAIDILPTIRPSFPASPINDMMSFQLPAYTSGVRQRQNRSRSESEMSAVIMFNSTVTNLPPVLRRDNEETRIINNPDLGILFGQMHDEQADPISFIVNKNLVVRVKVVNMDCCVEKKCWSFVSDGMGASNQEEIVILIKCDSFDVEELTVTRKVLQQMNAIFEKAKHGHPVSDLEQMEFEPNMLCMPKNVAMLFFKPTLQCVKKLILPTSPYLFGLYIENSEVAWAKNVPLRLLLRIGAEFKYYPCPLFNVLDRPPVYDGVGRTILDLLADFHNFQYTLPRVVGVTINLRGKDTIVRLPQHRYDEVMKAVNASEENVFSLAGNFSSTCDGHLVSVEKDGRYKTQTLSIVLKENRKITCGSFIVISAALKPNQEGIKAKASIVEDGVMVQVTADVMKEFKKAIKEMKEYSIIAADPSSEDSSRVGIEWSTSDVAERPRLLSPIDATSFDNLTNMKIRHSYDYTSNNLTAKIHWVEVYFLPQDNDTVQRLSARELGQMTSSIAKACMSALSPHLMTLIALEMTRIGLRVNLAADFVEYKIGADLATLPAELLPNLDDKLVPAIHAVMSSAQERVAVELIFQVVKIV